MSQKKKIKYEKPQTIDLGKAASVLGATCSVGTNASDGCNGGNDPAIIPYCPGGNVASANCYPTGGTASQSCYTGSNPGW